MVIQGRRQRLERIMTEERTVFGGKVEVPAVTADCY